MLDDFAAWQGIDVMHALSIRRESGRRNGEPTDQCEFGVGRRDFVEGLEQVSDALSRMELSDEEEFDGSTAKRPAVRHRRRE